MLRAAYATVARMATLAGAIAPHAGPAWVRSLAARRGVAGRFAAWAATRRDLARPLLWVHAASVGEGLQLQPIIERVRRMHPELQVAYTHFSPSAAPLALSFVAAGVVDVADYLPLDSTGAAEQLLAILAPSVLVFGKLDVWPVLVERAARRGVRLGMVSATLSSRSGRRGPLAAALLGPAYQRLDAVGAIAPGDADRLRALGVRPDVLSVTGDARYDHAWTRADTAAAAARTLLPALADPAWQTRTTLVAGSTWPADERVLLEAWETLRREAVRPTRLILAPHEPTAAHLAPIERWAAHHGVTFARLGQADAGAGLGGARPSLPELILVDRVGVLADLYAAADIAYVGGGFHAAGVHSVVEPAACGVPVLVGPHASDNHDVALLVDADAAHLVHSAAALATQWRAWIDDPEARRAAGDSARGVVREGRGAADRSAALIDRLLEPSPEVARATAPRVEPASVAGG